MHLFPRACLDKIVSADQGQADRQPDNGQCETNIIPLPQLRLRGVCVCVIMSNGFEYLAKSELYHRK